MTGRLKTEVTPFRQNHGSGKELLASAVYTEVTHSYLKHSQGSSTP